MKTLRQIIKENLLVEKRITQVNSSLEVLFVFDVNRTTHAFDRDTRDDIEGYINEVVKSKECLTSDDITISNYLAWKNIPIIRLNFKNFNKWILYKMIIFKKLHIKGAANDNNAIHLMPGGHKRRYFDACVYLKSKNMLFLNIRKGCIHA